MVNAPLVSVIVPIYNTEKFLNQCVNSILAQTYKNIEVILVDDGSTDNSNHICNGYALLDSRIKVIKQQNKGAASARNAGLSVALGEYIAFIDSDDWVEDRYIDDLVSPMLNDEEIDISIGLYVRDTANGEQKRVFKIEPPHYISKNDAIIQLMDVDYWGSGGCIKLYRATLFENSQYMSNITYGEDLFNNWSLFNKARKIYYAGTETYHYTENHQSFSHNWQPSQFLEFLMWLAKKRNSEEARYNKELQKAIDARILSTYHENISKIFFQDLPNNHTVINELHNMFYKNILDIITDFEDNIMINKIYGRYACKEKIFDNYKSIVDELMRLSAKKKKIFIYGAGDSGKLVLKYFKKHNINCEGFVVSSQNAVSLCEDKKIYSLKKILLNNAQNIVIILAMNDKNINEVYPSLQKYDFEKVYIW